MRWSGHIQTLNRALEKRFSFGRCRQGGGKELSNKPKAQGGNYKEYVGNEV